MNYETNIYVRTKPIYVVFHQGMLIFRAQEVPMSEEEVPMTEEERPWLGETILKGPR